LSALVPPGTAMIKRAITLDTKMGESVGFWKGCPPTGRSTGCQRCYAVRRIIPRWYKKQKPYEVTLNKNFNKPRSFKRPSMVFVCPLSDFFVDDQVANDNRDRAWAVMRANPQHIFWITTKRATNISRMLPPNWPQDYGNVWLGVSAENQAWADKRMPILRNIPIHPNAVRFVIAEPLLGPIQFRGPSSLSGFSWVTSGGESGDSKLPPRPAKDQWFLDIAAQCGAAGVPFFLMQRGGTGKCRCHHDFGCRAIPPGPNGRVFEGFPPQVVVVP
jgi:protein gp37